MDRGGGMGEEGGIDGPGVLGKHEADLDCKLVVTDMDL